MLTENISFYNIHLEKILYYILILKIVKINVMHEIKLPLSQGSSAVGVSAFCPQTATSPEK